jgi:hypothetical protein
VVPVTQRSPSPWSGALAGYVASRAMDVATTAFYRRQSETSRRREQQLAPGGTLVQLGKQLGRAVGRSLDDEAAGRVGVAVHRSFGVTYGVLAAALTRRGMTPLAAGLTVGTAAFLLVDEGTSLPRLPAYPLVSHARGVVGHATLGLVLGLLLRVPRGGVRRAGR